MSDFKLIRSETVRFLLGEEGDFKRVQGEGKFWWRNVLRNGVVGYHEADSEEMDKLIAENERLQARVAEQSEVLTDLAVKMKQDFYLDKPTHDAICRAIEDNSEAFIKRKQAEAVNEVAENMCIMPPEASMLVEDLHDLILQEVQRLRSEASKAGGADNAK